MHIQYTLPHRIYRFVTGIQANILNDNQKPPPGGNPLSEMKRIATKLKAETFANSKINYQLLKTNAVYQDYRDLTGALQSFDLNKLQSIPAHNIELVETCPYSLYANLLFCLCHQRTTRVASFPMPSPLIAVIVCVIFCLS